MSRKKPIGNNNFATRPVMASPFIAGFFWLFTSFFGSSESPRYDAYDVALHLQKCTGRPVFITYRAMPLHPLGSDALPPCDKDSLAAWLAPRKLKVFWEDSVLLIDDPDRYSHHETLYSWNKLKLDVSIRRTGKDEIASQEPDNPRGYKFVAVRRALSDEELREAGDWILQNVPMPPVGSPTVETACYACPSVPPDTAVIKLEIRLEAVKLSRDGLERIVGLIGTKDTSRIAVGRFEQGRFHIDWVSPLLDPERQVLIYRDVNSDGIAEIWSLSVYVGASELPRELSIFDGNGKELTREAGDCEGPLSALMPVSANEAPLPTVCPIVGLPTIDHFLEKDGTVSLEAYRDFRGSDEEPRRYRFSDGKYILESTTKPVPDSVASGASDLNRQGIQLLRQSNYLEAANKFVKAAQLKPTNSEFANNAGFAFYRLGKYEESIAWLKKAIEIDPKRAVAYLNLGDTYAIVHRNAEARQAYAKYLELAPNSKATPEVKKKLGALSPTP